METAILLVLALASCFVGFELEVTTSNIGHVRAGRPPNAGAALLPNIPLVPLGYLAAAWGIDRALPGWGFAAVAAYAAVSITWRWLLRCGTKQRLNQLTEAAARESA